MLRRSLWRAAALSTAQGHEGFGFGWIDRECEENPDIIQESVPALQTKVTSLLHVSRQQKSTVLHDAMKNFYGFDAFRPGQFEVMEKLLDGSDVISVMPTGHGKSLCYQLPPLASGKPALIISPLISLMEDQVSSLRRRGIAAAYVGKGDAWRFEWQELQALFMSPESAVVQLDRLSYVDFSLIAIDEAHCVSEWGHDFRASYRDLKQLRDILPGVPILAVTATATQRVVDDINESLGLKSASVHRQSFNRPNLHYTVKRKTKKSREEVLEIVKSETCSIIYCLTIKQCEKLHGFLTRNGVVAGLYHGKLPTTQRMETQRRFMMDDIKTIICTVAFGMGVDKPNVRHVIHYGHCSSLTNYYQQTGRAGRDGEFSRCTMFISVEEMVAESEMLLKSSERKDSVLQELKALAEFAEVDEGTCRRKPLLKHFGEMYKLPTGGCGACDHCDQGHTDVVETLNITKVARDLLGIFAQLPVPVGQTTLVALYKGTGESKMVRASPFYGKGRTKTPEHIEAVLKYLVMQKYVSTSWEKMKATDRRYVSFSITDEGKKVLLIKKELIVKPTQALLDASTHKKARVERFKRERERERADLANSVGGYEFLALFEGLKEVLKNVASAHQGSVAPASLVSDRVLRSITRCRPTTASSLLAIPGLTAAFVESHGTEFTSFIGHYCSERGLRTDVVVVDLAEAKTPPKKEEEATIIIAACGTSDEDMQLVSI